MRRTPPTLTLFLLFLHQACADFGDYADTSFNCPAQTTCPVICTANLSECPTSCPAGQNLCPDGSCKDTCTGVEYNKCSELYTCTPFACAKTITDFDSCEREFKPFYENSHSCPAYENSGVLNAFSFGHFLFYAWLLLITALIVGWGRYNAKKIGSSLSSNTAPLDSEVGGTVAGDSLHRAVWTQTAYKTSRIGSALCWFTWLTWWGIQLSLLMLTIFFYQENGYFFYGKPGFGFEDEQQILFSFEIVWTVGFAWCLWLAWLDNFKYYFLMRCGFDEAEYVAIYVPTVPTLWSEESKTSEKNNIKSLILYITYVKSVASKCSDFVNNMLASCFSDPNRSTYGPNGSYTFNLVELDGETGRRSFYHCLRRYNFSDSKGKFECSTAYVGSTIGKLLDMREGLSTEEAQKAMNDVGINSIRLKKPDLVRSIQDEFDKVFYLYQNFLIWAWFPLWYYYIAILHTAVRLAGGLSVAYFQWRNDLSLYKLGQIEGEVGVLRDGQLITLSQTELVPGDVVAINSGLVYTDLVIISSEHILVDESALTGEVTPVSKVALDPAERHQQYNAKKNKKNTISAGTTVIESDQSGKDFGIVLNTGSFTAKGELLRDILSYQRHRFKFDVEIELVLLILAIYAVVSMIFVLYLLNDDPVYGWFYAMYVVGTALPPLLPTVFVVSVGVSENRLAKKNIASTDSRNILIAGKVSVAFFDKTGTLTKQGLSFMSTMSGSNWNINDMKADPNQSILRAMAVTNTLTRSFEGAIIGNLVDQSMFEVSGASLDVSPSQPISIVEKDGSLLTVIKRFDFDHARMTQAVIVRDTYGQLHAFVKGSQESIKRLCDPSTLPVDYDTIARSCARQGIYQIAMASAKEISSNIDIALLTRTELERDLCFIGFVNFKNELKNETVGVLHQLDKGNVRSIMITGDNIFTGINIARECNMIKHSKKIIIGSEIDANNNIVWIDSATDDIVKQPSFQELMDPLFNVELAMTGEVWSRLLENSPAQAVQLSSFIRVYGRCTPNDKVSVVATFVREGHITLMCGDGGNDCGALKTAHVGVALSKAEASIVSPFTSLNLSITAVTDILKEGRCALSSAFSSYKYMITYGQVETFNQVLNSYFRITFADWNWVFMDGIWLTTMAFTLTLSQPASTLSNKRPTASLLGPQTMASVLGILIINYAFTLFGLAALFDANWFSCRSWNSVSLSNVLTIGDNYESEIIFLVSGYQYISSAIAFNFGYSHRAAWFKNYWFLCFAFIWTVLHYTAILEPGKTSCLFRVNCVNENVVHPVIGDKQPLNNPYNTTLLPLDFRWLIILLVTLNAALNICWDYFVVYGPIGEYITNMYRKKLSKTATIEDLYLTEEKDKAEIV